MNRKAIGIRRLVSTLQKKYWPDSNNRDNFVKLGLTRDMTFYGLCGDPRQRATYVIHGSKVNSAARFMKGDGIINVDYSLFETMRKQAQELNAGAPSHKPTRGSMMKKKKHYVERYRYNILRAADEEEEHELISVETVAKDGTIGERSVQSVPESTSTFPKIYFGVDPISAMARKLGLEETTESNKEIVEMALNLFANQLEEFEERSQEPLADRIKGRSQRNQVKNKP